MLFVGFLILAVSAGLFLWLHRPTPPQDATVESANARPASSEAASPPAPDEERPAAPQAGEAIAAPATKPEGTQTAEATRKLQKLDHLDRRAQGTAGPTVEQQAAVASLRQRLPGVNVQFDPITGAASNVVATGRLLTPAAPASGDVHAPAREFVDANAAIFGHAGMALKDARITREDVTPHNGMRTVVWQQQVDAIPLYKTILKANLTKNGELVTIGSHFLSDAESATAMRPEERAALIAQPPVDAAKAVSLAAANLGDQVRPEQTRAISDPEGAERRQRMEAPGLSDTTAGLAWLPVDATAPLTTRND